MNQIDLDTAHLMIEAALLAFALQGGTAISLSAQDMPRLSVGLDRVFVDHRLGRVEALARINDAIQKAVYPLVQRGSRPAPPSWPTPARRNVAPRDERLLNNPDVLMVVRT